MSEEREELGCEHYKRHCKLVAPCCGKVYNCRFCHDEAEPTHSLDRKKVEEVECLKCNARGPAEADCKQCGVVFGSAHFCSVCRLYDDVNKGQFHCEGCGICRVGGREKFEHCNNCGLCLPKSDGHKCRSDISKTNCPVCMEDLHTSRVAAHIPPCSHLIHTTCYHDMLKSGLFACPTCGLSMQPMNWAALDREVAATPMPLAYRGLYRKILCKDCHDSTTAIFHIVGMKCGGCGSYNTTIDLGPLLVKVEGEDGESFRPLTAEEEERLGQAEFPVSEGNVDGGSNDSSDEDGWETTEEDPDDSPELQEEELD